MIASPNRPLRKALVVGGGLAGMSAAIGLGRAGVEVELVDIDPDWKPVGAGLTLTGALLRVFHDMGLLANVAARGFCSFQRRVRDGDGRILFESDAPLYGPEVPNSGGILRPVIHEILREAIAEAGAAVRLGVSVAGIQDEGGAAAVSFSDGGEGRFDLVVGADGLNSSLREMIFPDAPKPRYTGQGCWRAVIDRPPEIDGVQLFFGVEKAGLSPVSQSQMYLFKQQHLPGNPRLAEADWLTLLRQDLATFGGPIGEVRDSLGPDTFINYRPLHVIVVPDRWYRGRVLLIGDAAHASTPHAAAGGCMAVEDGFVLGQLAAAGLEVPDILEGFMRRRYARCAAIVEGSVRVGQGEIDHMPPQRYSQLARDLTDLLAQPI